MVRAPKTKKPRGKPPAPPSPSTLLPLSLKERSWLCGYLKTSSCEGEEPEDVEMKERLLEIICDGTSTEEILDNWFSGRQEDTPRAKPKTKTKAPF